MPNKFYRKGARKEYKIIKRLLMGGADIAQRTAGSHSPIDIIAIWKKEKIIKLIQSKAYSLSQGEENKIKKDSGWLTGVYEVFFEVE